MSDVRQALIQRIAAEVGYDFLVRLEEELASKFRHTAEFSKLHFDTELQARANGSMQQLHILQQVVKVGAMSGLAAVMMPTNPKGHHYAKITLPSFIVGGMRVESTNWQGAKYAKSLGKLNAAIEPLTADLFDVIDPEGVSEKIFLVVAVAENVLDDRLPVIDFAVPYSSLDGYHLRVSLEEVRQAALEPVDTADLEPLPRLKKRLDDEERGAREA